MLVWTILIVISMKVGDCAYNSGTL